MKKLDLQKFKKPTKTFLGEEANSLNVEIKEEAGVVKNNDWLLNKNNINKKEKNSSKVEVKKNEKLGRPQKADELLNKNISILLTESEFDKINQKAGLIPRAAFIRDVLIKSGIFK